MYKNIINPVTGKKVSIFSKIGKNILNNYMNQIGSGKCSICHSVGTTKATCPLNSKAKHPNASKHPKTNSTSIVDAVPLISGTSTLSIGSPVTAVVGPPVVAGPPVVTKPPVVAKPPAVFLLLHLTPIYKGPPPPKFDNINGLASIVYYDLSVNGKRKRILFASEFHEFPYDERFFSYIRDLSIWIQNRTTKKGCLDIHAEFRHKWAPTPKLRFDNQSGGKSILSEIGRKYHDTVYENIRYHKDDTRGYYDDDINEEYIINYLSKHFNFNILQMIALGTGMGPYSKRGKPANGLKKIWNKVGAHIFAHRKQTWKMLSLSRNRFRKSMILFMREYKISQKKIYDAIVKSFRFSTRGATFNFGWEALYDIYSFFRMFRTFNIKRTKPCPEGDQNNIINISHFGHATGIWFLIYNIFGIKPNYIENIPFVEKAITDFFKNIHQLHFLEEQFRHIPTSDLPKIIRPLGKSDTPLFFN